MMIRVQLPFHLRTLAQVSGEVQVELAGPATMGAVLDALEAQYPNLRGTMRDQSSKQRRPFIRFFACEKDLSNEGAEVELPEKVVAGEEPLLVVGAIAGG